ncbi:hypothetical protein Pint_31006 [Pistacia integerrima]|uniref:Uncharacterized protein n=1 Tax=Pistacia integerrima TaxID=434235 RepID=A0ACC0XQZ8_9ROSI|nr:hypothetical protein Pint_31006 [Pistacia integerrima]
MACMKQTARKSIRGKAPHKQLAISFGDWRSEVATSFPVENCGFERDQKVPEEHRAFD